MKKLCIICFTLLFMLVCVPAFDANAAEDNAIWSYEGGTTWSLKRDDGTDITVKLVDHVLHVQGYGAVPSYAPDSLGNRPWNTVNATVYEILVYNGITSIGSKAFSNMNYLEKITMPATVFLEDGTVFAGSKEECQVNILGTNMATEMIGGKIPYTSLDSIVHFALANLGKYNFVFANNYMTRMVKLKSGNKLIDIVSSDDYDHTTNENYPYIDISTKVQKVSGDLHYLTAISTQSNIQGKNALEIFALMMGDNQQYVGAYNVSLNLHGNVIKKTDTPVTYCMDIPNAYKFPGRQFSLIQFGAGTVNILSDEDLDENTITFTTDYPSTVYALVYSDAQ